MAGTVVVGALLAKASQMLNDNTPVSTGTRWPQVAVLIPWLNFGMVEVAKLTRDGYVVRKALNLNVGQTLQQGTLPSDAIKLLRLTRNMGTDGKTPGKAIRLIDSLAVMDAQDKDWHFRPGDAVVTDYIRDDEDFQSYYVSPKPVNGNVWVEALYTEIPPAVAALTDTIPVADKYQFQLQLFTVGMALMQDISAADVPRGQGYLNLFYASLGVSGPRAAA